ncbi:MAG TPA: PKD domain-containing protein [Flavipsychrobacter sp.]|nr:PKD domain-containing protein [Flavipsychrobacter sp.]
MKSKWLLLFISLIVCLSTNAQQYKWIKGGGSITPTTIANSNERVTSMCTDDDHNVYVVSPMGNADIKADTFSMIKSHYSPSGFYYNVFFASYDCNGNMRWAKLLEAPDAAALWGLVYDDKGNIYTCGALLGGDKYLGNDTIIKDANYTGFLAKFDTSGKLKWINFMGPDIRNTASNTGGIGGIDIDGKGYIHFYSAIGDNVQLTPTVLSVRGTYDLKYDTFGNLLNAVRLPIPAVNSHIVNVAINKKNDVVYAIVQLPDTSGGWANDLAAYDTSGNQLWFDSCKPFTFASLGGLAYDQKGTIYTSGGSEVGPFIFAGDSVTRYNGNNNAILKIDTLGHVKESYEFDCTLTSSYIASVTLLNSGMIGATGLILGEVKYGNDSILSAAGEALNPLVIILDTSGTLVLMDQLHGSGSDDLGTVIASDKANNIYLGGQVESDIYAGSLTPYYSVGGNSDFFVMKYGYNCDCAPAEEPTPFFIVTDSTHALDAVAFTYKGSVTPDSVKWNFGDGTISTTTSPSHTFSDTGVYQVCLTAYACDSGTYCQNITVLPPTGISSNNALGNVSVYPNPMSGQLFIENAEDGDKVKLYDIMGRAVYKGTIKNEKYLIDTRDLSVGTYLLELTDKYGRRNSTTVVKQ